MIEKNVKITIDEKACKKCGLCIAFCPKKVYVLAEDGRPAVARLSACTNCKLCELRCPDYAIVVGGEDDE